MLFLAKGGAGCLKASLIGLDIEIGVFAYALVNRSCFQEGVARGDVFLDSLLRSGSNGDAMS